MTTELVFKPMTYAEQVERVGPEIKVLDSGYVQGIESWGSDERIVEAARMSTDKGFLGWGTEKEPGDEKLLSYLYKNRHDTPFEMAGMVLQIKAPIFVFREWQRHRTQSYNEMSARYIPLPNENYLPDIMDLLQRSEEAANTKNRQASGTGIVISRGTAEVDLADLYDYYTKGQILYERFLENGWPKELARLPVPVARYSCMRASANLRNWLAFLTLRMDPHAQKEIRLFANQVGTLIETAFPRTWALFCAHKRW
jgi:thymidylate synthase (FAD)